MSEQEARPRVGGIGVSVRDGAAPGTRRRWPTAVEALLVELGGRRPPRAALEAEVGGARRRRRGRRAAGRRGRGRDRRRARRQLAAGDPRPRPLRDDPGPLGRPRVAQPRGRRRAGRGAGGACREQGVARIEVGLPREGFAALAPTEAFYRGAGFEHLGPRMRRLLDGMSVSELVMVEQRRRRRRRRLALGPRRRTSGCPAGTRDARLIELRAGLVRHAGVRALDADAADAARRADAGALHERAYLRGPATGSTRPEPVVMPEFAPPGLEPDIPVNAGLVAAAREGVRTAITRRPADARRRPLHLRRLPPARPPRRPRLPRRLLLPQQRRRGGADAARRRPGAGRRPRPRPPLPERHRGAGRARWRTAATLHSLHASPVTNVAAGTVLPQARGRTRPRLRRGARRRRLPGRGRASIADAGGDGAAALVVSLGYDTVRGDPHGGWAFEPEIFADGRPPAAPPRAADLRRPGGRLRAVDVLADCSHAFATGLLGEVERMSAEPASSPSAAAST